jgi:hypothetical protein
MYLYFCGLGRCSGSEKSEIKPFHTKILTLMCETLNTTLEPLKKCSEAVYTKFSDTRQWHDRRIVLYD